jgi:hypothetical protein
MPEVLYCSEEILFEVSILTKSFVTVILILAGNFIGNHPCLKIFSTKWIKPTKALLISYYSINSVI